jgi:type IV pilus assembly protein PilB
MDHSSALRLVDAAEPQSRTGGGSRFLTDVILELGMVDRERVDAAIEAARSSGRTPESLLVDGGLLSSDQLARAVAVRYGLQHLDLSDFKVDMAVANLVDVALAKRHDAVPVSRVDERTLLVAMVDPANVLARDDLAIVTGMSVQVAVVSSEDMGALVARLNRFDEAVAAAVAEEEHAGPAEVVDLHESADDAPVIKLVNSIIAQAAEQGASDIHFEPEATGELRVRYRIDGVLGEATSVPRRMVAGLISRVKIMCDLDIAERRVPQDGRVGMTVDGRPIDLRVVTLPTVHGESAVMRLLDKSSVVVELDRLGMQPEELDRFERAYSQTYGAILVTGPTGSGKSTTLYGALSKISTPDKNVITIEDPVEYQLPGITQIQVNPRAGLSFATGLRSMMRADPDVIMVGEIRDRETAQIAVEAALTGHLVMSTLHTNDAPTTVTRLTEMGIEPFLLASAVDCVVAQRLARVLCSGCKRRIMLEAETLRVHGFPAQYDIEAYEPVGCARCNHSGYKGRVGLYEVMTVSERIRELVVRRASADEIGRVAEEEGMRRLRDDGLTKVRAGITSISEVARVTGTQ